MDFGASSASQFGGIGYNYLGHTEFQGSEGIVQFRDHAAADCSVFLQVFIDFRRNLTNHAVFIFRIRQDAFLFETECQDNFGSNWSKSCCDRCSAMVSAFVFSRPHPESKDNGAITGTAPASVKDINAEAFTLSTSPT